MAAISTTFSPGTSRLSIPVILIKASCIFSSIELIYQLVDLFTNSHGTIYLIHNWYYTWSFITTILSIPVLIYIWKLKAWAVISLITLTAVNQIMWFSFGIWDYRMLIFPVLFLLVWIWHITRPAKLS